MRTLLPVSLVLAGALALAGCGEDAVPDGTIELRWTIGAGTQTCDDVMITSVKITLEESEGGIQGPFDAACTAGRPGPYALEVPPGSYYVVIDGYNGQERIYTGRSSARYTVESDATTTTTSVTLSPVPASIEILWRFSDGRQCTFHMVETMSIVAFLSDAPVHEEAPQCGAGAHTIENVLAGTYDVQVTALGTASEPLFRFTVVDLVVEAGSSVTVDEILVDCAEVPGGCT